MRIEFERVTVASSAAFVGVGIHSGDECRVVVRPGNEGIIFRSDGARIPAVPEEVSRTPRSTWLGPIRTVEHLMSALAGAEITDAEVDVEGEELPILDGGAMEYLRGIDCAGTKETGRRAALRVSGTVGLENGLQQISVALGDGRWRYEFDSGDRWPGRQSVEVRLTPARYAREIAPAKTTVFEDEIEAVRASGLGLGGNEKNTLVIGQAGYLTESRFPDEAPRHKLLDCIGDLALSGVPVRFLNVVAHRTGHEMNVRAAARLAELCNWEET
ncbi:MAG: UDP-3-O-acyl-N-acetylglucosamine deacetylase [Armatimonadetes bacterium]|nr:UDP-3-O-acyl-N-acetylglucosamine deacetylase [Armatimonadota bacterium]